MLTRQITVARQVAAAFGPEVVAGVERQLLNGGGGSGERTRQFVNWSQVSALVGFSSLIIHIVRAAFDIHAAMTAGGGRPNPADMERRMRVQIEFPAGIPQQQIDQAIAEAVRRTIEALENPQQNPQP